MKINGILVKKNDEKDLCEIHFENVLIKNNDYRSIAEFLGEDFQIKANNIEQDEIIAFPNSEFETNDDANFKKRLYIGIDVDGNFVDCGITIPLLQNYFFKKIKAKKIILRVN